MKLVDPLGEMLEQSWEGWATKLANAEEDGEADELVDVLLELITKENIDLKNPAEVVYARDTRPSGVGLLRALVDGLDAMGAKKRRVGADTEDEAVRDVTTTPILHYLVRTANTKDYGENTKKGYYVKLAGAFGALLVCAISSFGIDDSSDLT